MTRDKEGKFVPENINTRYGKLKKGDNKWQHF